MAFKTISHQLGIQTSAPYGSNVQTSYVSHLLASQFRHSDFVFCRLGVQTLSSYKSGVQTLSASHFFLCGLDVRTSLLQIRAFKLHLYLLHLGWCFFVSDQTFKCHHHSSDPHISPSLEISLLVFTVTSITHFDHMASFGCFTFHLPAHKFVASLHLTIMGFSSAYHFPLVLIPLLVHHFVEHSRICVNMMGVDRYTMHRSILAPMGGLTSIYFRFFLLVLPLRGPSRRELRSIS